jgi:DUF4097 and DUF4098 domain-containing protein YvlB
MKSFVKLFLSCLACLVIAPLGCTINPGCSWSQYEFERTDHLTSQVSSGSTLSVETDFGSITIRGEDTTECNVVADVTVRAPTEQEAEEIAQKVKVHLAPQGSNLLLYVEHPELKNNRSVGVSFEITVPRNIEIRCETSYGSIEVEDIIGSINADTSFASITCLNVQGDLDLDTSYGSVECDNITSKSIEAESSFGSINIECSPSTPADINADIETSYGNIRFVAAPDFAGSVSAETSFGSIKTDLPIMVIGEISKDEITGTIGEGEGYLNLKTSFGSIRIK